ncbi:MAG: hypothetical protein DIZ78_12245 [endosymbiont of Escarpia spicata]|uniref:Trypsin-co-occurring domain-containing protein n=1 Tax=endosymbiont of Escarpia spicata TaxID=2200908 RepID=A0A370DHG2_9GAMM|nr:MAG: hypothetical protein DIZ78_12245 [endosymbiont of Escarpia spicata]
MAEQKDNNNLELAQLIKSLRNELSLAQEEGKGEGIRFTVEDVELDLEIAVEEVVDGGIAAKFYVLTSHYKAKKKDAVRQKIKLKLKPEEVASNSDKDGNRARKPLSVSGKRKARSK